MSQSFPVSLILNLGRAGKALTLAGVLFVGASATLFGQGVSRAPGGGPPAVAPKPAPAPAVSPATAAVAETGAKPSPFSPNTFAQEALKKLAGEMEKRADDVKEAAVVEDGGESGLPVGEIDKSHQKVLGELMQSIFLQKGSSWFTQTVRDAIPVPYEFKDLELSGPTSLVVTATDKANGIDQRLSYGFSVSSHRKYAKATGWQAWEKGKPVLLNGIIMNREDGVWVVASSPLESYSLR
jgi:hypothetical protein